MASGAPRRLLRVVMDCGFEKMTPRFVHSARQINKMNTSTARQLCNAYGLNRKLRADDVRKGCDLVITDAHSPLVAKLEEKFLADTWSEGEGVFFKEESVEAMLRSGELSAAEVVYLTPDAEEVLEEVDPEKTYVIGCYTDRSIDKYATAARADDNLKVSSRRFPLHTFFKKELRHQSLNVDTAFEVLMKFYQEQEWSRALIGSCIPKRLYVPEKLKKAEEEGTAVYSLSGGPRL
jgi:hypothetical protein